MNTRELLLKTRDMLDERTTTTGSPQWEDYQLRRWLTEAQKERLAELTLMPVDLAGKIKKPKKDK